MQFVISAHTQNGSVEIIIQNEPGRTNMSHEPRTTGWLGSTNNVNRYAHGQFHDEQAARAFVASEWLAAVEIEMGDRNNPDATAEFTA